MLTAGLYVIGGAVGTRVGTQAILGSKNTGVLGYIGNAVIATVLGQVVGKIVLKSRQAATMLTIGGFAGLALRLITDLTPYGKSLALSGVGDWGMAGFVPQSFPVPQQTAGWPNVQLPGAWAPRAAAPAGGSNLGRLGANRLMQ